MHGILDYATKDRNGFVPDFAMIGTMLRHSGNQKVYIITGFIWSGNDDEWYFTHHDIGVAPIPLARPMSHIDGNRANGIRRYSIIKDTL
jgi:hypothetical protein